MLKKNIFIILVCILAFCTNKQPKINYFDVYSNKAKILVKDSVLNNFYLIDSNSVNIFKDTISKEILFKIYFDEVPQFLELFNNYSDSTIIKILIDKKEKCLPNSNLIENSVSEQNNDNQLLKGKKIAIDPGHFAGNFKEGIFEGKAFKIGDKKIYESKLNYSTALFLKDSLEKLGATVFLTINKHGNTSYDKTFDEWFEQDLEFYLNQEFKNKNISEKLYNEFITSKPKNKIFLKFFRDLEIRERASKINKFKPDLTIIIHYDIDYENWKKNIDCKVQPSKNNIFTAFVSGAFTTNELESNSSKLHFLRLIVDSTFEKSCLLANCIAQRMSKLNNININKNITNLPWEKGAKYTNFVGVYSRNLGLTRMVNSPLCYCEGFYQDNEYEYEQITNETIKIYDIMASKRTQEVALCYLAGIICYFDEK